MILGRIFFFAQKRGWGKKRIKKCSWKARWVYLLLMTASLSLSICHPTNNALLINFRLSSDAEILLISTEWAHKSVPNAQKHVCNVYIFQLSIHFGYHGWWLGRERERERDCVSACQVLEKCCNILGYYRKRGKGGIQASSEEEIWTKKKSNMSNPVRPSETNFFFSLFSFPVNPLRVSFFRQEKLLYFPPQKMSVWLKKLDDPSKKKRQLWEKKLVQDKQNL